MKKILLTLCTIALSFQLHAQYLKYHSKDSVNGKPRHEGYIFIKMKLNGVFDISGGLQGSDVFNIGKINVWDNDNTPNVWMDMFQSQIRFSGSRQVGNHTATGYVEGDFWGGSGHFRLRVAYMRYWFFQFGQDWSFFGDKNVWPNLFDWDGPPTGVWSRMPHLQFFIERPNQLRFEIGLARQLNDEISFLQNIDPDVQPASGHPFPDIIGAVNKSGNWGHIRFTGMFRTLSYEKTESDKTQYTTGFGFTASGLLRTNRAKTDMLQYQLVYGQGISSYLASFGGTNSNALPNGQGELNAIPAFGGWVAYEHFWNTKWHFNLTAGYNNLSTKSIESFRIEEGDLNILNGKIKSTGLYLVGNVMYDPFENFTVGVEYNFGYKENTYTGNINTLPNHEIIKSRSANRISFGLFYNF